MRSFFTVRERERGTHRVLSACSALKIIRNNLPVEFPSPDFPELLLDAFLSKIISMLGSDCSAPS